MSKAFTLADLQKLIRSTAVLVKFNKTQEPIKKAKIQEVKDQEPKSPKPKVPLADPAPFNRPSKVEGIQRTIESTNKVPDLDLESYLDLHPEWNEETASPEYHAIKNNYTKFFSMSQKKKGAKGELQIDHDTLHCLKYLDSHKLLSQGVMPGLSSTHMAEDFRDKYEEQHRIQKEGKASEPKGTSKANSRPAITHNKTATRAIKSFLPCLDKMKGEDEYSTAPSSQNKFDPIERKSIITDVPGFFADPEKKPNTRKNAIALDEQLTNPTGHTPRDITYVFRGLKNAFMENVWKPMLNMGPDEKIKNEVIYHKSGARGVMDFLHENELKKAAMSIAKGNKKAFSVNEEDGTIKWNKGYTKEKAEFLAREKTLNIQYTKAMTALLFTSIKDDVTHELSMMGEPGPKHINSEGEMVDGAPVDPGDLWYDDNMMQTDYGIAKVINHLHDPSGKKKLIDDTFEDTAQLPKEQHYHMSGFKALMAPTSFGNQPGSNLSIAFAIYKDAAKKWQADADENGHNPRSVFSYLDEQKTLDPVDNEDMENRNKIYHKVKAISNSMEMLNPPLYKSIMRLYRQADEDPAKEKELIAKAQNAQKEWIRREYGDLLKYHFLVDEKGKVIKAHALKLLRNGDSRIDGETFNPDQTEVDLKKPKDTYKDDLDIIMTGALKKPNLSSLNRYVKTDVDSGNLETNSWIRGLQELRENDGVLSQEQKNKIKDKLATMELTKSDLGDDWTMRGASINSMLRFIKGYAGEHGTKGLHKFLTSDNNLNQMAEAWVKHSVPRNKDNKSHFDLAMEAAKSEEEREEVREEYADFVRKSRAKLITNSPKTDQAAIREGEKNGNPIGVHGSYVFGPKGGNFFQDISYQGGNPTKDLWFTRAALFVLGGMTNGSHKLIDTPPEQLRETMDLATNYVAASLGMSPKQIQAIWWYYKKNLDTGFGVKTAGKESYVDASLSAARKETNDPTLELPAIRRTGKNSSRAAQRSANAKSEYVRNSPGKHKTKMAEISKGKRKAEPSAKARKLFKLGIKLKFAQFTPSPNGMTGTPAATRTNKPFSNSIARSPGGKNLAQGALGNQINSKAGVETSAQNAIHDGPVGSEESIVHMAPIGTDAQKLKYLASWHGISGQKKSMLVFIPNPNGPDSMYHIEHPSTDVRAVKEQFDLAGIKYKTILPGAKSTKVMVFDPNKQKRNTVAKFATLNNLNVEENSGQGEIVGHNGDWNSAGALPKSRQAYQNIIGEYENAQMGSQPKPQASNNAVSTNNPSSGKTQQFSKNSKNSKTRLRFDRSRRILEGFLRQHNTPNKELPPVGDLLQQDLSNIKPEHLSKYQQLVPSAKWEDIEGAVNSLQNDPSLYDDMTSESNRREMYCKEHARTVLQSSGLKKLIDSLMVQQVIPEHAQHLIEDAKDGDYFSLDAISSELNHSVPSLRAFAKAAEKEYNKAGKAWDKMRTGPQPQKFAKKSAHAKTQYRAGTHGVIFRGSQYNGGQFAPQNDGIKRFHKDSNLTDAIKKLRGA